MNLQDFLEIRDMVSIVEHKGGRITMRVSPRVFSHPAAGTLKSMAQGELPDGVLNVGMNIFTASLSIDYDPHRISSTELEEFLTSTDAERIHALAPTTAAFFGIRLEPDGQMA